MGLVSVVNGQQEFYIIGRKRMADAFHCHFFTRRIDTCIVGDDSTCEIQKHEVCKTVLGISSCFCRPGYGRRNHRRKCESKIGVFYALNRSVYEQPGSISVITAPRVCGTVFRSDKTQLFLFYGQMAISPLDIQEHCVRLGRLHSSGTPVFRIGGAGLDHRFVSYGINRKFSSIKSQNFSQIGSVVMEKWYFLCIFSLRE